MLPEQLLTVSEAAEALDIRKTELAYMRRKRTGPAYVQFSPRNIRYRWSDIIRFQSQPKCSEPPAFRVAVRPIEKPTPTPKPLSNCTRCGQPDTPVLKTGKCLCSKCITDINRERIYGTDGKDMWTGKCHICECELYLGGRPYSAGVRLAMLDHCHASGVPRGWLCHRCNSLLGKLKDEPRLLENAVTYLTNRGMFS
jgi:hypothetical protein